MLRENKRPSRNDEFPSLLSIVLATVAIFATIWLGLAFVLIAGGAR